MAFDRETLQFPGIYRAQVLDNTDPLKRGRVRARVFGVFTSEIPTEMLPWAAPAQSIFSGSGTGYGHLSVPEVNSFIFVFFESGDVYQPVYFAEAVDGVHGVPSESSTNYPSRKTLKTKNGVVIYVDDADKEVKVVLPSGTHVKVGDEIEVLHVTGAYLKIDTSGNITISGTTVNINP